MVDKIVQVPEQEAMRAFGLQGHELADPNVPYVWRTRGKIRPENKGLWTGLTPDDVTEIVLDKADQVASFRIRDTHDGEVRGRLNDLIISKADWEGAGRTAQEAVAQALRAIGHLETAVMLALNTVSPANEAVRRAAIEFLDSFVRLVEGDGNNPGGFFAAMKKSIPIEPACERVRRLRAILQQAKDEAEHDERHDLFTDSSWVSQKLDAINELFSAAYIAPCPAELFQGLFNKLKSSSARNIALDIHSAMDPSHSRESLRQTCTEGRTESAT